MLKEGWDCKEALCLKMNEAVGVVCKAEDVRNDVEGQISVLVNAELRPARSLKPLISQPLDKVTNLFVSVCL